MDAQEALNYAVEAHKKGDYATAVQIYHQALNQDPNNAGLLYLMGDLAVRQGCNGLAINLLKNSVAVKPQPMSYIALGCALKAEHFLAQAEDAWKRSAELEPTSEAYNNLASLYSDSGQPNRALQYLDKSLALEPDNPNAHWNKALALLTAERWKEAWPEHERRFDPRVQKTSVKRSFGCPDWDGRPVRKLVIHGEQGVGDEIMFMSCMDDVLSRCDDVVMEVEPRLMDIVERSFPSVRAYGSEDAVKAHESGFDAQIALGSLPLLFRNSPEDFPRAASYLTANPERVAYWRDEFRKKGPGPYIGVTWAGGTKATRNYERTVGAEKVEFVKAGTAISLQYGDNAEQYAKESGFHFFPESVGRDMSEHMAMAKACDFVVTVAQTLVHECGSLGVPCFVLTPLGSSWRYGTRDRMVWYGDHVKLLRQTEAGKWDGPLARAKQIVDLAVSKERGRK